MNVIWRGASVGNALASTSLTPLDQYVCKKLGLPSLMIFLCMKYQITIYFIEENYVVIMEGYLYMCTTSSKQNLHILTLVVGIGKKGILCL